MGGKKIWFLRLRVGLSLPSHCHLFNPQNTSETLKIFDPINSNRWVCFFSLLNVSRFQKFIRDIWQCNPFKGDDRDDDDDADDDADDDDDDDDADDDAADDDDDDDDDVSVSCVTPGHQHKLVPNLTYRNGFHFLFLAPTSSTATNCLLPQQTCGVDPGPSRLPDLVCRL